MLRYAIVKQGGVKISAVDFLVEEISFKEIYSTCEKHLTTWYNRL